MKATEVGSVTCVGHPDRTEPSPYGNCFDLGVDGVYYRVANFNYENFEELQRRGLTFPIEVEQLCDGVVVIMDPRIGERWYDPEFCPICVPRAHLPIQQSQRRKRDIARGRIVDHGNGAETCHFLVKAQFE